MYLFKLIILTLIIPSLILYYVCKSKTLYRCKEYRQQQNTINNNSKKSVKSYYIILKYLLHIVFKHCNSVMKRFPLPTMYYTWPPTTELLKELSVRYISSRDNCTWLSRYQCLNIIISDKYIKHFQHIIVLQTYTYNVTSSKQIYSLIICMGLVWLDFKLKMCSLWKYKILVHNTKHFPQLTLMQLMRGTKLTFL